MSFFYYDVRGKLIWVRLIVLIYIVPTDKYEPKEHRQEELDALKVPLDKRDSCKNYYAEFRKCIMV
jgi:hypothetical protein